jgi:GntR family transcriptional regulator
MSTMPAQALDRLSPVPLWAQLEAELRRRLESGDIGDRLPPENQLTVDYAVSRQTVREALRRLRDAGLLSRERGRGTFVTGDLVQPLGMVYSLFRNVESQGVVQASEVRVLDQRRDPEVAQRLGLEVTADLVHLERLRLAAGEPLALDRVWLPATLAAPLLDADFHHTALYDELARRCSLRIDGGWERIRPVVPSPDERRILHLRSGMAAFAIERLGRAGTRQVEWRTTLVRGDRYSVMVEWTPAARYSVDLIGGRQS